MELVLWITVCCVVCMVVYLGHHYLRKKSNYRLSLHCQHVIPAPDRFTDSTEVVIVGAGVLGSAIGAVLAKDGHNVLIIERDTSEPKRIVGELLQPGGYKALKLLGLAAATEGIDAHTVHGYVVHDNESQSCVELSYPCDETKSIQTGRSYHHGRFIMGLRREAKSAGANLLEGTVTSLLKDKDMHIKGVAYRDKTSGEMKTIKADLTIVADGCFSRFRKGLTEGTVSVTSHFAGTIMENCPQYKSGHAEIVLGTTGPILVYQISSTETRILVDIRGKMPHDLKEYFYTSITPQLPEYMRIPFKESLKNKSIQSMPNSFLPPVANPTAGVLLLGDAFNMRHPLTGAGMSVALNDVVIWRKLLADIPNLRDHQKILKSLQQFQWKRKHSHSFVVNILAQALYTLFSAADESLYDLRRACFEYFKLGGKAVSGPVGLLSVINPNPPVLIGHFFAVALYAIIRTVRSHNVCHIHHGIYRSVLIFFKACAVIFPLIASELSSILLH